MRKAPPPSPLERALKAWVEEPRDLAERMEKDYPFGMNLGNARREHGFSQLTSGPLKHRELLAP